MTYLKLKHKRCSEILRQELFDDKNQSLACEIYRKLTYQGKFSDNSLGENLNSLLCTFELGWFQNFKPRNNTSNEFYFTTFIFWLYLFHERIEETFKSIYTDKETIKENMEKMPTINTEIRIWANFIKHPKEYIFCHYSFMFFEDEEIDIPSYVDKFNFKEIQEHYSSYKNDRPKHFQNSYNKCIIMPNLENLLMGFCNDFKLFVSLVCGDERNLTILSEKSCQNFE